MSQLRKTISRRLVEAKNTTAMLTTFNEVDMTAIMEIRSKYKDKFKEASIILASKNEVEGTVAVGGVTSDDLQGELKGKSLEDLHKMLIKGGTYVVVDTKEYPRGEIGGGEFVPIDRFFPDTSDFQWN